MANSLEPKPPKWLSYLAYWFRLGLILLVAMAALLGITGCTNASMIEVSWLPATELSDSNTLTEIVQTHTSDFPAPLESIVKQMRGWRYGGKKGILKVYDFHNPNLCGYIGCLYVGYLQPAKAASSEFAREVFSAYINPHLPPHIPLLQAKQDEREYLAQGLPCLVFNQLELSGHLRQLEYCFNGRFYQLTDSRLLAR